MYILSLKEVNMFISACICIRIYIYIYIKRVISKLPYSIAHNKKIHDFKVLDFIYLFFRDQNIHECTSKLWYRNQVERGEDSNGRIYISILMQD